jgi:hypothetical protein
MSDERSTGKRVARKNRRDIQVLLEPADPLDEVKHAIEFLARALDRIEDVMRPAPKDVPQTDAAR